MRNADRRLLWPALLDRARRRYPEWTAEQTRARATQAWQLHLSDPSQWHWHCPCGQDAERELLQLEL